MHLFVGNEGVQENKVRGDVFLPRILSMYSFFLSSAPPPVIQSGTSSGTFSDFHAV